MIKTYYLVTKPGIIMGNLITTVAGFALASAGFFDLLLFSSMFVGLGLVIASACVFNNYIDRVADAKMKRTKNRAMASGAISEHGALWFAITLAFLGFFLLGKFTNTVAVATAFVGFFIYVGLYSFWKYKTSLATLVGSIAGAVPPVVGYAAATGVFDARAAILFLFLVLWQMPHFYSIAIYRMEDYAAANIPVLPIAKGVEATKRQMAYYILGFMAAQAMLFAPMGMWYLLFSSTLSIAWGALSLKGFTDFDERTWARNMFLLSLVVITALSGAIVLRAFI